MTLTDVFLACLGGVAGSAVLVFAVETLVAFVFPRHEPEITAQERPRQLAQLIRIFANPVTRS